MQLKILSLCLLCLGEIITIYAEIAGALATSRSSSLFSAEILQLGCLLIIGSTILFLGYCLSILAFKDIWAVTAISIGIILLAEPGLSFYLFRELPSLGSGLGLLFGAIGLLCALV